MFDGDKVLQRRQERCLTYQDGIIHRTYARFVFSIEEFFKTGVRSLGSISSKLQQTMDAYNRNSRGGIQFERTDSLRVMHRERETGEYLASRCTRLRTEEPAMLRNVTNKSGTHEDTCSIRSGTK